MKHIFFVPIILLQTAFLSAQTTQPPASATSSADSLFWQPTAELNEHLPPWLQFNGTYRIRIEDQGGIGFKNVSDGHTLSQLQFGMKIQPVSWLSFYGQAQDARIFWNNVIVAAPPYENTWDLHQAWGEVGNLDKFHARVRVGRQELNFGEQRLVGMLPWVNAPRVFDAALGTVNYDGVRVDAFASSVVNSVDGAMDHHKQGNPFYGAYGSLTKVVPQATIEPYVFWRLAPTGFSAVYANGIKGHLDEKTYGFRWVGKLPWHFDYGTEMARQSGMLGTDSIGSWAGHWILARTFPVKLKPRVLGEYNFASGTANPNGTKTSTFDQLYPSGHDLFGLTDQVGWRNMRDLRTGVELRPSAKLFVSAIYNDLWLADARDGLYSAAGAVLEKSLTGAAGTHIGQEFDIEGTYQYNKAAKFGLGYGHLECGEFLKLTTPGHAYNYPYAMLTYAF